MPRPSLMFDHYTSQMLQLLPLGPSRLQKTFSNHSSRNDKEQYFKTIFELRKLVHIHMVKLAVTLHRDLKMISFYLKSSAL